MSSLKKSGWGQVALSFVELNEKVGGYQEQLITAFVSLYQDLAFKEDVTNSEYQVNKAEHIAWENAILKRISDAENDIAQTIHKIDVVLIPKKAALEKAIANNEALIITSNNNINVADAERAAQEGAYQDFVTSSNAAIEAINECLELLAGFESSSSTNLVQITKAKSSFKKVQKAL